MQKQSNPVQIVPPPSGAPKIVPALGSPSAPGAFGFHGITNAPLRFGGLKRDILEGFKKMAETVDDAALQKDLKDVLHDHLSDAFGAEKENAASSLVAREQQLVVRVLSQQFSGTGSAGNVTGPMAKERALLSKITLTEQQKNDLMDGNYDACLYENKAWDILIFVGPTCSPWPPKGKPGNYHVANYLVSAEWHLRIVCTVQQSSCVLQVCV